LSSSIGPDSQNTNHAVSLMLRNQDVDEIQPTQGQQQPSRGEYQFFQNCLIVAIIQGKTDLDSINKKIV